MTLYYPFSYVKKTVVKADFMSNESIAIVKMWQPKKVFFPNISTHKKSRGGEMILKVENHSYVVPIVVVLCIVAHAIRKWYVILIIMHQHKKEKNKVVPAILSPLRKSKSCNFKLIFLPLLPLKITLGLLKKQPSESEEWLSSGLLLKKYLCALRKESRKFSHRHSRKWPGV